MLKYINTIAYLYNKQIQINIQNIIIPITSISNYDGKVLSSCFITKYICIFDYVNIYIMVWQ
jgi:hypothetical protein